MHGGAPAAAPAGGAHAHHENHGATNAAAATHEPAGADDCVMGATCHGPVTALASLIWIPGVLEDTQVAPIDPAPTMVRLASQSIASFTRSIDLPPPRV